MEEPKNNPNQKQKAPVMTIKLTAGGGGIGGIIFLGGTLIAATLVSAFAFRRGGRNRRQHEEVDPPSSTTDKENHHSPPPPSPTTMIDLPSNLEMMMKSSKDHHQVISKGLSFLLPADSPLPIVHKNPRNDAIAEMGATRIESTQALILDDEKSKLEISGKKVDTTYGDEDIVLSEIHKETERTPLFDNSGLTAAGEEFSCPILDSPSLPSLEKVTESSNLELESMELPKCSMGCDQETLCSSSPVLLIHEKFTSKSDLLMEHPSISMEAVKLMEGDSEETNATPDDGNQIVVEEKEEIYDTILQEMIVEDEVQIVHDDQVVDEEEKEKECEDQEMIKNCDEENIGVAKEGEVIKLACDHVIIGEDRPEVLLVGQKQEELQALEVTKEQDRVESVSVDQIEVEDTMAVELGELIGKEEREGSFESTYEKDEDESVETVAHAVDQIVEEEDQQMELDEDKQTIGDDNGKEISTEAHTDQVVEENNKVSMTNNQETVINRNEEGLQSDNLISIPMPTEATNIIKEDEESIKVGSLVQTEGEDIPDVKLNIEEEREECDEEDDGDVITRKCEYASIETVHADELEESLANNLEPENANENDNPEKGPLSTEANSMDEVSEIDSVDQMRVEDTIPNHLTETAAIAENTVEKNWVEENPQIELSENEKADDGEDNYEDEDEDNAEKGEDSSEGTGDSSMESNSDAIWPAESTLEVLALEFNKVGISNLKMEEESANLFPSEEKGDVTDGSDDNADEDEVLRRYEAVTDQLKQLPMEPWNLRNWTQSMLVSLGLPFVKVSLIAIILSIIVVLCGFSSHVLASQK